MRGMEWLLAPYGLDTESWATGYRALINKALREHVEGKAPKFEETLRRIVREEMRASG